MSCLLYKNPWNKANNGIKLLTCKSSSSSPSKIFFAYQCHADFLFFSITHVYSVENSKKYVSKILSKLATVFSFYDFLKKGAVVKSLDWMKQ